MLKELLALIIPGFMILNGGYKQSGFETNKESNEISGNLLIVGGGLIKNNFEIYEKFIQLAGGNEAKIAIFPTASCSLNSSRDFKQDLISYGVLEDNIEIIPIMVEEDRGTNADKSIYIGNSDKKDIAEKVRDCTGIWFVGGDQCRITKALYRENGENTLALNAIWEMYKAGGVIGGTSAGAAVMSNIMIGYGDSLGALNEGIVEVYTPPQDSDYDSLYITKGLGFFKYGIIDQHFDTRARLGRLISAAYEKGDKTQFAYGIDENTAMIVNNKEKKVEVLGIGGITVVDVSRAVKRNSSSRMNIKDIYLSYIVKGDTLKLDTKEYNIDKAVIPKGKEYWDYVPSAVTGVLSAHGVFKDFISHNLIDNYRMEEVVSYCFDREGKGSELLFRKTKDTKGYWSYDKNNGSDYSFINVALDIRPINITINFNE